MRRSPLSWVTTPFLNLNGGYSVAQGRIRMLQPLHNVIQQLLRGRLMGTDLQWTLVSHLIQPLR
jgi:hypothetical protein